MSESIASDAEIEAALKEADRNPASVPDLDQDSVVPVPVETRHTSRSQPRRAAPRTNPSTASDQRIVVVQRIDDTLASEPTRRSRWHLPPIGDGLYHATDTLLTAINRPFHRLGRSWRDLIGLLAIVTIIMSIVCWVALPLLFPPRDPISVLQRKTNDISVATDAAPPESPR